ncbi:hypothetical protein KM043_015187 [Ampulex compressa]|nr:hypothetical protein KM043_015187 [Ampulex compressa]
MRDRDCNANESTKKQSWKARSNKLRRPAESFIEKNLWPKVMISREKRAPLVKSTEDCSSISDKPTAISTTNDRKNTSCDMEELFCAEEKNVDFAKTNCSRISSSTEVQGESSICATCKDCLECQEQARKGLSCGEFEDRQGTSDNIECSFNSEFDVPNSIEECSSALAVETSVLCDQVEPILVDLTNDDSKVTWKQTILKRFCDAKGLTEEVRSRRETENGDNGPIVIREARIMIADSSSRVHRGNTGSSIAMALRDRGPCVIPVQPNPSLPIRPAPPAPTRSIRKDHSAILQLSKAVSVDVVEVESPNSLSAMTKSAERKEESDAEPRKQGKREENDMVLSNETQMRSEILLPRICNVGYLAGFKRKTEDDSGKAEETAGMRKEVKKRRKSHEADSSQSREEERVESILKEFSKNFCDALADEGGRMSQQGLPELWDEKKCAVPVVVSTTDDPSGKEIESKLVPPLRLKKVIRKGTEEYHRSDIAAELERQSNYRIVTGATPCPEPTRSSVVAPWCNIIDGRNPDPRAGAIARENRRSSSIKSDGYKLKYRRNRLRQKLRELQNKAMDLARQMASQSSVEETSPQQSTRLRQTMNRYEKQIENLSKLLSKLSATMPIVQSDVVKNCKERAVLNDTENSRIPEDREDCTNWSTPSPEPPQLSPRLPADYTENKSPGDIRNSPPVLPRAYLAMPIILDSTEEAEPKTSFDEDSQKLTSNGSSSLLPMSTTDGTKDKIQRDHARSTESKQETSRTSSPSAVPEADSNALNIDLDQLVQSMLYTDQKDIPGDGAVQYGEIGRGLGERQEAARKEESVPELNRLIVEETDRISCFKLPDNEGLCSGPIVSSITSGTRIIDDARCNEIQERENTKNVGRHQTAGYYDPQVIENSRNEHEVPSGSNQSVVLDSLSTPLTVTQVVNSNQQLSILSKNCDQENPQNESLQPGNGNRIMTEQFPTLGNWVARMSKKHVSKSRSKLPTTTSGISTDDIVRVPRSEMHKATASNASNVTRNNIVNVAPQWNTERWQRQQHQQQRQQQQLLQQVAAAAVPPPPLPSAPSIRSEVCPPIPMTQFYPNSYAIDPYSGAALGYHAICPYGNYPYHPRMHPGSSLTAYPLPLQDGLGQPLRSLQHVDKRLPTLQDPTRTYPPDIMKYPTALSTSGFSHSNGLDYNRLRTSSAAANGTAAGCLPPLLLPPPQMPTNAPQSLQRTSLGGFSGGQFGRNRMIPDVVAAAAAAAVVAAASFGRQHSSLATFNRPDNEAVTTTSIPGVLEANANQLTTNRPGREQVPNQRQVDLTGFNEEVRSNGGYHQLHNLLLDRLPFTRPTDSYGQAAPVFTGEPRTTTTTPSLAGQVGYKAHARVQASKDAGRNEPRNCETPHLGKVNRSPNTMNNVECSNCGLTGSMFKCLGCEAAFYCNERCQTRHWHIHVERCPKKMPKLKKVA